MRKNVSVCMLLVMALLSGCANRLFYFPDRTDYEPRLQKPVPHEDVWIESSDGLRLHGWFLKADGPAKATVVHLHGNAQNLTSHVAYVDWLPAAGYNVLTVDYRGYGLSSGRPDRKGVLADARAAYDYARRRPDVDPQKMILLGQSLGAANALVLAGTEPLPGLRAVIADSPFYSYGSIAREKILKIPVAGYLLWPFSPLIVSNGLSPSAVTWKIAPAPLLLIHGTADEVIPAHHSERLFERAAEPRLIWLLEGAGHTEALGRFRAQVVPRLQRFLDYALSGDPADLDSQDRH
ncbi:MAG: alpha/beta fold hydrolase [Moraxellaceae bacterium]|nr:alpha/beta fold hydrolase [Moraxellaceae bacterium]